MNKKTMPLMFCDGEKVFKKYTKEYICHSKGFFILAPSGAGKTHFVKNQKEKHWIDGDMLWNDTNAHPQTEWWLEGMDVIMEVDQRSDIMTVEAKKLGLWIMGASNAWLKPDAIVIPNWRTHQKQIKTREETDYDGGAKSDALDQVLGHRKWISQWQKKGVPKFNTIEEAAEFLAKQS